MSYWTHLLHSLDYALSPIQKTSKRPKEETTIWQNKKTMSYFKIIHWWYLRHTILQKSFEVWVAKKSLRRSKISISHLSKMFSSDSLVDWVISWDNEAIWLCIKFYHFLCRVLEFSLCQILFGCRLRTDYHLPVDLGYRVALMTQIVNMRYSQL